MATQIPNFAVTNLTLGAHSTFHSSTVSGILATGAEALHITDQFNAYKAAVELEASVVNRQTTFVATESMKDADEMRDDMLAVINAMISAHQYTHIANKKAAYQALNAVMAPYRGIRAHEYSRQTAEINGLLAEFQSPGNAEYVQTLGLNEEIEMLTLANAKFSVEFNQKTAEMASRLPEKETSTVEARAECDRLYAEIVALINAYALIQPSEEITGFVQQQTGLVETYRLIAANTGKSKKEEEPTPETENSVEN